ncbi:MAG: tape measure protein [Bacteroides sp.]|nr:tape measure protein [Bacteroides sp.]
MSGLRFEVTAENGDFLRRMEETQRSLRDTRKVAEESGASIGGVIGSLERGLTRLALVAGGAFSATKAIQLARECINVRSEVQDLEKSFSVLLKSEDKAGKLIKEIRQFAATTPMDMSDLAKGAQTMLSFNIEGSKIMPLLKSIGDISKGDANNFSSLSLAFSQMSATGKLMGQDLMQMINAGFNPLMEISRKTGKSIGDLKEEMEKGKISVDMVTEAFISATAEGGQFHGMLASQASGLKGSFAYLRGAIADMMSDIGGSMEGVTVDAVNMGAELVKNYKDIAEAIAVLATMYGTYKAAVVLTTAAEAAQASGTTLLAASKLKLTKIVQQLHATMAMNPYGLVLAAVVALTYGIYKLTTYQTDLEKSTKLAQETSSRFEGQMRNEQKTLDSLSERLSKAKQGTEEWKITKDRIVSQFGKYHSGLDEEITKTGTLAGSYETLARSIRMSAAARAMAEYDRESGLDDDIAKSLGKIRKKLTSGDLNLTDEKGHIIREKDYTRRDGNGYPVDKFISATVEGPLLEQIMREAYDYIQTGDESKLSAKALGYLQQEIGKGGWSELQKIRARKVANDEGRNITAQTFGTNATAVDDYINGIPEDSKTTTEIVRNKKYWESKRKEAQTELEALTDIEAKGAKGEMLRKKILEYDKTLESYNAKEKKSTGLTADQLAAKEENASGKLADVIRKQAQERLRLEQDYEYERWQTRIDLMEDGETKVLAQQELDFAKEKTALQRRKEQEVEAELQRQIALFEAQENVKAAADKKYAKKTFRDSDIDESEFDKINARYEALEADLTSAQKKAEQDRLDASKESMNAYLKEFGSYQQKRLAIAEEYETKISEAQNDGERMILTAQRNKALSDLDYDEWVDTGTIALAFGDISKLSDSTIGQLISDMEKYREKVIQTFDPEKIEKYEEALSSLRRVKSDESFGAISSFVPDYFKERRAIGDQMDSAGSNVNALYERRAEIYNRILSLRERISRAEKNGEDVAQLNGELREAEVELSSNAKAAKKAQDAFKLLQEQWDQLETPEAKFYALCNSISAVTGVIGPLASQASEMVDALGVSGLASALGTLGEAMDSVGNIASGFANGGLVGGIAAAAGEVMGWVGKIFSAGDRKHDRNIERLQEQIDALNKSYEKLGQAADNAFSTDVSALIEQQDTLLRQQQVLIRKQMAEEEAKKKTDKDKIKQYQEQLEEINEVLAGNARKAKEAIIGEDLKSAINEFASLYAEAWNDGTDAAQKSIAAVKNIISSALSELLKKDIQPASERFYNALAEAMKDGVLTDVELDNLDAIKSEIDALASKSQEQWEMIQSRYKDLDELKEELTDISFDSVRDNFKSKLADMKSTSKDFIDDFSSMLRDALINGLMDEKYDLMLREWYDEFAEAMNDRSLTDSERDALRQQYDAIVQQGLADRDFINEIIGGGAYSQETSKGWSTALTQDQGDELNGRFTTMVELEATNNTLVAEGNIIAAQILDTIRSLSALSMTTEGDNSTLREIRDMMFLSTGHLEDISKYTKQLITIREGIDKLNDLINKRL